MSIPAGQSAWMPALLMTAPQRVISERMLRGEFLRRARRRDRALGIEALAHFRRLHDCRMSAFSFITIARGVPAGATIPYHCTASNPLTPDSEMVGVCGKA